MNKTLDLYEYANDANAQAAFVTNAINTGPDDADSALLIHFDGADGITTYTAETGQTVTFAGTAQLDTAYKEFGSASLLLDGDSDYVSIPDNSECDFSSGDFTIDFWIRPHNLTGNFGIMGQYVDSNNYWEVYYSGGTDLRFDWLTSGTDQAYYKCNPEFSVDTWYHVALVRNSSNFYIFVNGISKSLTVYTAIGTNTLTHHIANLEIGRIEASIMYNSCWIDEVRVSKGIAHWTSNFTPQTFNYMPLQCGSEATIKTQGSYSLLSKSGKITSSNKTLTRTVSPTIDLTGINQMKFDIRSSRTGSNIKVGIHDSGGTITEFIPNILSANTWQEVKINLQNVLNANKDTIDQIIITIVNADAENLFYIDNMFGYHIPQIVSIG